MRKWISLILMVSLIIFPSLALASTPGELLIWADDVRYPVMRTLGENFEADFGIPVKVQELGFGDIRSQLAVAAPAGEGPDIIVGAHDWLGELVVNGLIEPIELEDPDNFEPVTLEAFTWGDSLYGIPIAYESIGMLYNKALVPEAPETWEEMREIAFELTDRAQGRYGFLLPIPDPYHTFPLFSATGGYIFGEDEDGIPNPLDVGLNNEGSVRGMTEFARLIEDGLLPAGMDGNTMTSLFNIGQVGMIVSGPWSLPDAQKAGIDVGFTALPSIDGGKPAPFVGVQGFMISAFSKNKLLADLFLQEFVVDTDVFLEMFEIDPRPPAYTPALNAVSDHLSVEGVRVSAENGVPMPSIPEMGSVWTAWSDAIELVANKEVGPKEALDAAVDQILALIKESN